MTGAELFLSPLLQVLFEKLGSGLLQSFARQEGIRAQLKKWSKTLVLIQNVILDAEDKQITDRQIKVWLEYLRDVAYDLDDIVDEITTEAFRQKLMEPDHSRRSKVWKLIHTCQNFTPHSIKFNTRIASRIKTISARLDELMKQKNDLNLVQRADNGGISSRSVVRHPTTSLNESHVYGREREGEEILNMLLMTNEPCKDDVCVIPIVGMGGIGKTTLAQLVYNDERVNNFFDLKAWVCVSEEFNVLTITRTIFESVTPVGGESKNLNMLQVSLLDKLSKAKFLIVLDDVWNEDYESWDLLRRPFQVGLPGSRVIVTTRNNKVALMVGSVQGYHVERLTNDDCLSLLAQHARRDFNEQPELKGLGEELARKCGGLPLAAKALGGILRSKVSPEEWNEVLDSKIWDLPNEGNILPVLRLSYYHLPPHLKQLFAYCSVFPKDYEFDSLELVLLWMGEGFLQQQKGKKRMEELGFDYFNELVSRSFFQRLGGSQSSFVMHDLINDLAQFVAGGTCHRLDDKVEIYEWHKVSEHTRHASYLRHEYEVFNKFQALSKVRGLRTFIPMPVQNVHVWPPFYLSNRVLLSLLPELHSLRVLSLSGYSISELPSTICSLIHLRYLNLSGTSVTSLPESLSNLYNLQTLSLRNCRFISKLPETLGDLINLRHLDNANTEKLKEMPVGIGKLTSLQTLPKIVLGKACGLRLSELKNLLLLQGTLSIEGLQNVVDIHEAKEAYLKNKPDLEELQLIWSDKTDHSCDVDVLDMLQPHRHLKKLKIDFYGGRKFPTWIGDPLFDKLESISLSNCVNCTSLPHLGQLHELKHLRIGGMLGIKCIGIEFFMGNYPLEHAFPSLETLRFEWMPDWEEWSCNDGEMQFPHLHQLSMFKCPKLTKISPLRLPLLQKLDLEECTREVLDSFMDLSSLTYLKLESITGVAYFPRELTLCSSELEVLEICNCNDFLKLWESGIGLQTLTCIRRLVIADCANLVCLVDSDQQLPSNLEVLELFRCAILSSLPPDLSSLMSLRELIIKNCPKLVTFPELGLPPMLRRLEIQACNALKALPNGISGLERLELKDCSSLRAWPAGNFPTSFKKFVIKNCEHLEPVSQEMFHQNSSISLEDLSIWNWRNIGTLIQYMHNFSCLVELYISNCDTLESFPDEGLPTLNLKILSIEYCSNLNSIPAEINRISSLVSLEVRSCPKLETFPKGELPSNLTSLRVWDSRKLRPLVEWHLDRLTSLQEFSICGGFPKLVSFGDAEHLFPSSLTKFSIARFPSLKSVFKGLNSLTSLQHVSLMNCPKLQVLPCDKLLDRLWHLEISGCPHLKDRCLREKGEYWQRIADIPCVEIDGSYVYKQNSE